MSVAARFKFAEAIVSGCVPDPDTGFDYDFIDGLTLTQVMAFFWNLEDVEFTFAGSSTGPAPHAHTATVSGTLKFNPPTATGDFTNPQAWNFGTCSMLRYSSGPLFSDLPLTTKQPYERVCSNTTMVVTFGATSEIDFYKFRQASLVEFSVCNGVADPSLYAIQYRFNFFAGDYNNYVVWFSNPSANQGSSSGAYTSGTFDIGGHTFGWRCWYNDNITGASMSAASTSFTYP
jgi:hypothetical protein